jgi:hypothetical protein
VFAFGVDDGRIVGFFLVLKPEFGGDDDAHGLFVDY